MELANLKNRNGPPDFSVPLSFYPQFGLFQERNPAEKQGQRDLGLCGEQAVCGQAPELAGMFCEYCKGK